MQSKITFRSGHWRKLSFVLSLLFILSGLANAQVYTNGNAGTGSTSLSGVAAPAGFQWHELQNVTGNTTVANSSLGWNIGTPFTIADNFTVPAGPSWAVSKFTFYFLQPTASTPTAIYIRVYNGQPGTGGTIVYGDLTTNRLGTLGVASMYGVFNSLVPPTTPATTYPVKTVDANVSTTLAPGNYWVEFQMVAPTATYSLSSQVVGVRTVAGYNAIQSNAGVWGALLDAGVTQTGASAGSNVAVDIPFKVTYTTGACSGTPTPGATVTTATTVCPGTPFTLSTANSTPGSGVTYQWQSASAVGGPYTNIAGATSATYTVATQSATTYYQVVVTCGGNNGTSTPVVVAATPAAQCYCVPGASAFGCSDGDIIDNVTIGGINNTSACDNVGPGAVQGYSNYTISVPAGIVYQSASNPISVTPFNGGFTEYVGVWIDFNQNGTFDASEFTLLGSTATGATLTGNIVVPATALLGTTRMRVRLNYNAAPANTSACTAPTFGETEDYNVTITPCTPAVITGSPANVTTVCGNNATFTVTTSGVLPSFQWEYRTSASGPWLLVPNAAPYSGVNTATLTVAATAAQSGYQYRAIVTGACSGPDVSAAATLTVTPITLAVTPASVTKCATGAPVLLSVPNTQFTVTSTNSTPVAVPDNIGTASLSTNAIAGVPAGANIIQVDVTLNMSHTYPGDMIYNLKAPNGQIINLYKYNSGNGTGAASGVSTWGWYGAKISSNGTVAFTTVAAAPFIYNSTTNWKADLLNASVTGLGFPFDNPTGYASTATSWAQLASTTNSPNGTWTLAMADGGPGDVGTLSSWTITVTYGGAPATAVFSPVTGLYTNAAGTTAYTGTAVTQVYANPAANTTYTAIISAGACTGNPQTIPVNVNTPVGGTATLANSTICAGNNTSFALGGTLTGGPGFTHNFQVSTNNGVSYTNITNGGVYSGANTNTLVLTGVPYSSNGYKFRDSINTGGGCGSLISTVATLTVNPTPVVTISAAPVTHLYPGLTSTLTAAVSSATAPLSYQWYLNGNAVAGATANTYIADIDHEGKYTVKVTDANGCSAAAGTSTPGFITIGDSANVTILFIYPSPNSGRFQVRYFNDINNGGTAPAFVNVYDSKGARVFTRPYTQGAGYGAMNVDLGNHARGLYRVELVDLNGNRIKTGSAMVF